MSHKRERWPVTLEFILAVVDYIFKILDNKLMPKELVNNLGWGCVLFLCPSVSQCLFLEHFKNLLNWLLILSLLSPPLATTLLPNHISRVQVEPCWSLV